LDNLNKNTLENFDLIPVILAGGSGTRLWPLSRTSFPKQYLNIDEANQYSLLQNTFLRLKGLKNLMDPIIISNEEQRFIVAEQMREINVTPDSIILEPFGKNTAPAIALASLKTTKNNKDPILLIVSSDHQIEDEHNFRKVIEEGIEHAKNGRIVTFGITPDSPETGFGYIETFQELSINVTSSKVKRFIEKPDLDSAKVFSKDKHFVWNSGIFLFKASTILGELEKFQPTMLQLCDKSLKDGEEDLDFFRINPKSFQQCSSLPIDLAVMEKTNLGTVLALNAGWDDIGSWRSVWENSKKDENGNATKGKVFLEKTKNCYVRGEERLIVAMDINDLIIIETNDALLVSNKESSQKIKKVVQKLSKANFNEVDQNKKSYRPWGSFTSIEKGDSWQVKKLEIKPKSSISLQLHNHRSEHWIVVRGIAKVEINEKTSVLNKNESTFIPAGSKHRLSNPSEKTLVMIEVQSGDYLGEDDIIRFEDKYGRVEN
jgi:mannose-1-phosphate guanylyltransferase